MNWTYGNCFLKGIRKPFLSSIVTIIENTQIEDEEELKALKEKIHRIINSLTPRQKEIIYLRFLHQKEYEEIAQIMDMSEQAARNLTYRAMEKIRKENNDFFVLLFMIALFSDYHF